VLTYSYYSPIKDFSIVIKRLIRVEFGQENVVEDFFSPYDIRDGKYSQIHNWAGVVELE
jgi:hypothetical protein